MWLFWIGFAVGAVLALLLVAGFGAWVWASGELDDPEDPDPEDPDPVGTVDSPDGQ